MIFVGTPPSPFYLWAAGAGIPEPPVLSNPMTGIVSGDGRVLDLSPPVSPGRARRPARRAALRVTKGLRDVLTRRVTIEVRRQRIGTPTSPIAA